MTNTEAFVPGGYTPFSVFVAIRRTFSLPM